MPLYLKESKEELKMSVVKEASMQQKKIIQPVRNKKNNNRQ